MKLTVEQALEVRDLLLKGERKYVIAEKYNISLTTIRNIEYGNERFKTLFKNESILHGNTSHEDSKLSKSMGHTRDALSEK